MLRMVQGLHASHHPRAIPAANVRFDLELELKSFGVCQQVTNQNTIPGTSDSVHLSISNDVYTVEETKLNSNSN